MRGIVLPPFTFISERQRIFITFFVPPHFDNNLQHDKCFVIENNVWWLFISFTFYNSTVFRAVLIFVECTLTLEGSRKIKSEFPDESKQYIIPPILNFLLAIHKRCKTSVKRLPHCLLDFFATKNQVPAGGCHSHPGGH